MISANGKKRKKKGNHMENQSKRKAWVRFIGTNLALLACFLLMYAVSSVCRPMTRLLACLLYAVLWGMNSGMLFYRDMKAKDPVAFSHSKVARVINSITIVGVLVLSSIFFCIS